MDKTFDEDIALIRKAERGVEVREAIAEGMEYVKQHAEEVTGQQQAALQAAQTSTGAAKTATDKAAAAAKSESAAQTAASSAATSAQAASADAGRAEKSASSAEDSANRAAAIVSTDKTLSVEGAPADAKAVGDELKGAISADTVKTLIADALAEDHAKIKFWISEDPTSPAALFGGTWEQIAPDRVLMGASSSHAAGSTVEAGLPNITGTANGGVLSVDEPSSNGAFGATEYISGISYRNGDVRDLYKYDRTFDASRSNAIYGASSTVQPAAYYVYIWHRVA